MSDASSKVASRRKRTRRIRSQIAGNTQRHRLTVFRSNKNIYAQIIDDIRGITLVQASTMDKDFSTKSDAPFNKDVAREVGKRLAARAKEKNIDKVVFDRGPYLYHGKVKALADGARESGLEF